MMLGRFGGVRAADAHDAGRVWGGGAESVRLMLMMLAVSAADAHDADRAWGFVEESGQLMSMMVCGVEGQLMLTMLTGFGELGRNQDS